MELRKDTRGEDQSVDVGDKPRSVKFYYENLFETQGLYKISGLRDGKEVARDMGDREWDRYFAAIEYTEQV